VVKQDSILHLATGFQAFMPGRDSGFFGGIKKNPNRFRFGFLILTVSFAQNFQFIWALRISTLAS
jgi:hypothetical protein